MITQEQFYAGVHSFVDGWLLEAPVTATSVGDHRCDDRLGDYTQSGAERYRAWLAGWLECLGECEVQAWLPDARIDHGLMLHLVKHLVRSVDKVRALQRDPGLVVNHCLRAVHLLILRDFAPLPERMKNVVSRLRQVPRVLAEGRTLIEPRQVPDIWAGLALASVCRGVEFLIGFLPALAKAAPGLDGQVQAAVQTATDALLDHAAWIEQDVLPCAAGDFAAGRPLYDELLRESHLVDYDADTLLALGWQSYEDTLQQIEHLAGEISPGKMVEALLREAKRQHPSPEGLLAAYRQKVAEARQFVIDHQLVTIPGGERLRVEATPTFMWPVISYAAYLGPGFLEKVQEGVLIVTPVDGARPGAAEEKLRGHSYAKIPLTALHEAYPGHHVQVVHANAVESLPRKLAGFLSPVCSEGWAFYCEDVMERLGFVSSPIQRLAHLQAQLWRAARVILDVSLHSGHMSLAQAVAFLVERVGLEPGDARVEVYRYTQHPTQPQSYLVGKLQMMDIVAEYQRRYPCASLRQAHDAILDCGLLPPKLMRLRLFGPPSDFRSPISDF